MLAGTKGIDHASTVDYAVAKADGAQYVFRYSAGAGNGEANTQFKLCRPGEIAQIEAQGLVFLANSEWYETRCTEGAAAGTADGAADLKFWQSRSLPKGRSIYVSWDADPVPAKFSAVAEYMAAYNAALDGYYVGNGMYAGIPALVWLSNNAGIRRGWVAESTSWSMPELSLESLGIVDPAGIPDNTNWGLCYQPTLAQLPVAQKYMLGLLAGHKLDSCVWQDGNKWFGVAADENVLLFGQLAPAVVVPPKPVDPVVVKKLYQGAPVPALIARGTNQYLGNINGPAASHGGWNASEQPIVKMLQQRLIVCGFVPGHTNPNDGWADGIFDTRGGGYGGPTTDAVTRFQRQHRPTPLTDPDKFGQVWYDDWMTLFNL